MTLVKVATISGKVTNPTATMQNGAHALQLQCDQMGGELDIHGMSGAPILISYKKSEAAVGIVRQQQPRHFDSPLGVGNFFFACPTKAAIDSHPALDPYALDRISESAVNKAVRLVSLGASSVAQSVPASSPWVPMLAWEPEGFDDNVTLAPEATARPLRGGDWIRFRLENSLETRWKDPIASQIIALESGAKVQLLSRVAVKVDHKSHDFTGYAQCVPGFEVDIEWREATHVWGRLWGPIKLKNVRGFVDACQGKILRGQIVRIARTPSIGEGAKMQIRLRIRCDAFDGWLARDWPYFKGLESALSRNALYRTTGALKLRQDGHLLPVANELAKHSIMAMIPRRYRYLIGDRPIDPLDIQLVLQGLIDQYTEHSMPSMGSTI